MRFDSNKWIEKLKLKGERPPLEKYYKLMFVVFCAYLTADLITIYVRQFLIPTQSSIMIGSGGKMVSTFVPKPSYSNIEKHNIFNSDHQIAPALGSSKKDEGFEEDNDPVPTNLPLTLIGTIVHGDPKKSITTIQEQGKDVESYKVDEEIIGMAKIKEILRDKVIFRNLRNRKLEYIEIREENNMSIGLSKKGATPGEAPKEETTFKFQKTEIQEQLNNLSAVLNDATAVPNKLPDGSLHGFRLVHIKPGSIYERLGLKRGDVLMGVGGETIDSPQRAMEMYQQLKDSNYIELEIERGDGNRMTMKYNID